MVITRRSEFELAKARARAHVLDGLLIALTHLDEVIQTIRKSPDADVAKERLIKQFALTEIQAQAILDMQLRRLAALERKKIEDEHKEILKQIAHLEDLLAHPKKILGVIKDDLADVVEKYGDARRTRISPEAHEELREEDLVADEAVLVSLTERGYIKRHGRGGRGVTGHSTRGEDELVMLFPARSLHTVLFFSDRGKVYSEKAYQIPDSDRTARGVLMAGILALASDETITAAVAVPDFSAANFCTMVTRNGKIKRVALPEFAAVRPSGLIAISLEKGDVLGWVRLTTGKDELILVTEKGQSLRFHEKLVRPMGRPAAGVRAIRLQKGDRLTGMDVIQKKGDLLVVTRNGYGKRTPLKEYTAKGRGTMGVLTLSRDKFAVTGPVAAARVVSDDDDLTIISTGGIVLRTKVDQIKRAGRATMGVHVVNLKKGDTVAGVATIGALDMERAGIEEKAG
jgi:DNA gyrase subunit A